MTKRDYYKYGCGRYDLVASVGEELRLRAQAWNPTKSIHLIPDGIEPEEIIAPKPKPNRAPSKLLVIGSPSPLKGWADFIDALHFLENENALQQMTFDFCGGSPGPGTEDLKLNRLRHHCNFLGRVEGFRDLVRGYDLVINPSRKESFGMAALEVMAAGVPLLSSRTGVIERVQHNAEMLFPPHQPRALADALRNILTRWSDVDFGAAAAQDEIRRLFLVDKTADRLSDAYSRLLAKAA
jgi:glycosyltransferase involved in cell wall biosynthesis